MKKGVLFFGFFILVFILSFATAQLNSTIEEKAHNCIIGKVNNKTCSNFGLDDKIFALISVDKCENELLNESKSNECWGESSTCTIKKTSQAILALDEAHSNVDSYVNWLLNQTKDAEGLEWFIQVESPEATSCSVYDSDNNLHQISIGEDKKISSISATSCLNIDSTGYWLEIKPSCYGKDFDVSCDKPFLTNLLFKETTSPTIYVLADAQQSSGGGTNKINHINSLCFKSGSSCDYEGTLWATLVLNKLNYDVSSYFPYLIAFEDDNEAFIPESFLYILTNEEDFLNDLILKQKRNKYWDEGGNIYYDTALALLAFSAELEAKQNSVDWLVEEQRADGCWDSGSVAHTGFLSYALWGFSGGGFDGGGGGNDTQDDCEDSGYFCLSDIQCLDAGGNELSSYGGCSGVQVCCDENVPLKTCADLGGEICDDSTQTCSGQSDYTASDAVYGKTCCVGTCQVKLPTEDTCTSAGYACRDSCETGETSTLSYDCEDYQDCCMPESTQKKGVKWWIWLLIVLIVLVVLAIIFKNKIREFYLKFKTKKKPGPPTGPRRLMPVTEMPPLRRPILRGIPPQQQRQTPFGFRKPMPPAKRKDELDDVLKKLKEMGK